MLYNNVISEQLFYSTDVKQNCKLAFCLKCALQCLVSDRMKNILKRLELRHYCLRDHKSIDYRL